jgi:hypothetical protein
MADERTAYTDFGPLKVEEWLLKLWDAHGWPEDRVLKRMAEEQQAAAADPWAISYHRLGPAERNPVLCLCGLGPDAVVHNEPPHPFNGRPKGHGIFVAGICSDCHHHKSASCHPVQQLEAPSADA